MKERLGPAVSYAESLRAPAKQQDRVGKPPISHNPSSKFSKTSKITHTRDIVDEHVEGKARLQKKFLGFIPYRRNGGRYYSLS